VADCGLRIQARRKSKGGAGVRQNEIVPSLQAAEIGLKTGDVIVSYNGEQGSTVRLTYERDRLARQKVPPDSVPLVVQRDGEELTFALKVGVLGVLWYDYTGDVLESPASGESRTSIERDASTDSANRRGRRTRRRQPQEERRLVFRVKSLRPVEVAPVDSVLNVGKIPQSNHSWPFVARAIAVFLDSIHRTGRGILFRQLVGIH
jgi:hypothetical protein